MKFLKWASTPSHRRLVVFFIGLAILVFNGWLRLGLDIAEQTLIAGYVGGYLAQSALKSVAMKDQPVTDPKIRAETEQLELALERERGQ